MASLVTKVDICNLAVVLLGAKKVNSIDSPVTKEEITMAEVYPRSIRASLEANNWVFARKRKALVAVSDEETGLFEYSYTLPTDCLVPRQLDRATAESKPVEFEIALNDAKTGNILLTDDDTPVLEYTAFVDNPALFSDAFVEAASIKIAYLACMAIKGDPVRREQLKKDFQTFILSVQATNANTGYQVYNRQCDLIDARS